MRQKIGYKIQWSFNKLGMASIGGKILENWLSNASYMD